VNASDAGTGKMCSTIKVTMHFLRFPSTTNMTEGDKLMLSDTLMGRVARFSDTFVG